MQVLDFFLTQEYAGTSCLLYICHLLYHVVLQFKTNVTLILASKVGFLFISKGWK